MKARIFAIMVIVAMMFSAFGIDNAQAGAYATQFTTSVTYMNVGNATTTTLNSHHHNSEAVLLCRSCGYHPHLSHAGQSGSERSRLGLHGQPG